jgi:TPR repeat protein
LSERFGFPLNQQSLSDVVDKMQRNGDRNGIANVIIGQFYRTGDGRKQSYEEAAKHFAIAAEKGNAEGMYNLV